MKQWKILSLALLIMAGLTFTACQDDDDDIMDLGPTISMKTGEGYTHEDFEVTEGSAVKFGINAAKSTTHDNNLTKFNIIYTTTNQTLNLVDSTFNAGNFSADYQITFMGLGSAKITFKVTAQGGLTAEKELNVVVTEAGVAVKKTTDIDLGSFNEPGIGSFYSTVEEEVYDIAQATLNQEKIDFLFYRGATNLNTIAAPDDETAITVFQIAGWTTKNATRFNTAEMTAEEFDAIESPYVFPEFDEENATTNVNMLEIGDVVMFRTIAGKHGYIKVADIYRGDKIKIDVIVEE